MGRPRKNFDPDEVVRLRKSGLSWPAIARRMDLGQGTVFRAYQRAANAATPFQNGKKSHPGEMRDHTG